MTNKHRVTYFYHDEIGDYHYGPGHPMKPHRLALTNSLVIAYGLHRHMNIYQAVPCLDYDFLTCHSEDYIAFLKRIRPENHGVKEWILNPLMSAGFKCSLAKQSEADFRRSLEHYYTIFNFAADCPVFDGLYDFCRLYSGASLTAARHLCSGQCDVAINWSGGLHHAKKHEASGFCYINDIAIAAMEMLREGRFHRVLYIDIDVHHGDGVQEIFYGTDRVMTLSFHKYGDGFFPGTGGLDEFGTGQGKGYSLNVPLGSGIDDASYAYIFKPIVQMVISAYQPHAILLQCGADSLHGDRLGCFNLSIEGHGACISYVRSFNLPMLVMGGGGYTIRNVSRCWAHETALLAGVDLEPDLPSTPYDAFFAPDHKLHPPATSLPRPIENANTRQHLDALIAHIREQLRTMVRGGPPAIDLDYYHKKVDDEHDILLDTEEAEIEQHVHYQPQQIISPQLIHQMDRGSNNVDIDEEPSSTTGNDFMDL